MRKADAAGYTVIIFVVLLTIYKFEKEFGGHANTNTVASTQHQTTPRPH